jgi:ATP-dependent Clp protease ATP-binding subunit ClpA
MTPPPTLQQLIDTVREDADSDQPLDQLVTAAAAAAQLEETTDALLGHFVDRCRRDGRSWTEISTALGVTKQAVHKRFAPALAAHIFAASPGPTFERFTDRARHVIVASQQAAHSLGSAAAGTEHLLLGLFAEPAGIAGRALAAMNVTEDSVRAALAARNVADQGKPAGDAVDPSADSAPAFTEDGKRALSDALTEALKFGHNYIGTEHLLLGLYHDDGSLATHILLEAGALEATARAHVLDMLRAFQAGQ